MVSNSMTTQSAKLRVFGLDPFERRGYGIGFTAHGLAGNGEVLCEAANSILPPSIGWRNAHTSNRALRTSLGGITSLSSTLEDHRKVAWQWPGTVVMTTRAPAPDPGLFWFSSAAGFDINQVIDDLCQGSYPSRAVDVPGTSINLSIPHAPLETWNLPLYRSAFHDTRSYLSTAFPKHSLHIVNPVFDDLGQLTSRPRSNWFDLEREHLDKLLSHNAMQFGNSIDAEEQPSPKTWFSSPVSAWVRTLLGHSKAPERAQYSTRPVDDAADVLYQLHTAGLATVSDRLRYLYDVQADDPDSAQISLQSLKLLEQFLVSNPDMATDRLGVDSKGYLTATWILHRDAGESIDPDPDSSPYWGDGDGILVMAFQPQGLINFAANSGPPTDNLQRLRCSGILPPERVLPTLSNFTKWLTLH